MKRQQVLALFMSVVLSCSAFMPLGSITALAAEEITVQEIQDAPEAENGTDVQEGGSGADLTENEPTETAGDEEPGQNAMLPEEVSAGDKEQEEAAFEEYGAAEEAASEEYNAAEETSDIEYTEEEASSEPENGGDEEDSPVEAEPGALEDEEEQPVGDYPDAASEDAVREQVASPAAADAEEGHEGNLRAWVEGHEEEKDNTWQNITDWDIPALYVGDTFTLNIYTETEDGSDPVFQWYDQDDEAIAGADSASFDAVMYQEEWNQFTCRIRDQYDNEVEILCQLYAQHNDFLEAVELTIGGSAEAVFSEEHRWVYFRFTPEEDGTYSMWAASDYNTHAILFDSDYQELAYVYDGGDGENFHLSWDCEAGKVYYLAVAEEYSEDCSCTVYLIRNSMDLYGSAVELGDGMVRLTPLQDSRRRSAWLKESFDTANGLDVSFSFRAGGDGNDDWFGADGMVLMFSSSKGLNQDSSEGGNLGFLPNAWGVELDSYYYEGNDPEGKHIAIIQGNYKNHFAYKIDDRVDDDAWHDVRILYKPGYLVAFLDGEEAVHSAGVDLPDTVYVGASAATGGAYNLHMIKDIDVSEGVGNFPDTEGWESGQIHVDNELKIRPAADDGMDYSISAYVERNLTGGESMVLGVDVSARDTEGLVYQWYRDYWDEIDGADSDSLTVDEKGEYRCVVRDRYGNEVECTFNVMMRNLFAWAVGHEEEKEGICQNLSDWEDADDLQIGDSYHIQIETETVDGSEPSFQWYQNHKLLTGETSASFDAVIYQSYWNLFTCIVKDQSGEQVEILCQIYGNGGEEDNHDDNLQAWAVGHEEERGNTDQSIDYWGETEGLHVGDTYPLQVEAETEDGSEPVYLWYKNDELVEGTGTSSYDAALYTTDENIFKCCIQDQYGNQVEIRFYLYAEAVENELRVRPAEDEERDFETWHYVYMPLAAGETMDLTVLASALDMEGLTWKWKQYDPAQEDWRDIDGADTDTLSVSGRGLFRCVVTDRYSNEAVCEYEITIDNHLTAHPEGTEPDESGYYPGDITINTSIGSPLTLRIVAEADMEGFTYQWYIGDDEELSAEQADTLLITSVEGSRNYRCVVRDGYGNEAEAWFYVRVNHFNAHIGGMEEDATYTEINLKPGETQTLQAAASADDSSMLQYIWSWHSYDEEADEELQEEIHGTSSDTCTADRKGTYVCEITDGYGNEARLEFNVSLNHFSAYAADSEGKATYYFVGVKSGGTALLRIGVEADDPAGITYDWYKECWDEEGEYYEESVEDTVTAVCTVRDAEIGANYHCVVRDAYGNTGYVYFNLTGLAVYPKGTDYPSPYDYYAPVTAICGNDVLLEVTVTPEDAEGLTYAWYRGMYDDENRMLIEGADTAACTVKGAEVSDEEEYTYVVCEVSDQDGNSAAAAFAITWEKGNLEDAEITVPGTFIYDAQEKTPDVQVIYDGRTLSSETDYTVVYDHNVNAGTANVTVTGKGSYTGTGTSSFEIVKASISGAVISGIEDREYNGKEQTQNPVVKINGRTLEETTDYTVSYENNVNAGTATVTITGEGNYTGSANITFRINAPKQVEVTGIKLNKKTAEVATTKTLQLQATVSPSNATNKTVTWTSSDTSVATVDRNGLVKAKKYGKATITAKSSNGKTAKCIVQTRFNDVNNAGKSYYVPVYWAVDKAITVCTVTFRPEDPVTRGEFVAFLWRVAGKPKSSAKVNFKDVNSQTKFYDAIRWAVGKGIIKGYSDGTFRAGNNVTRGETATMLWRYAGKPAPKAKKSPFSDVPASSADSYKAILWGSEKGIIKGSGGKFLKNDGCTRGQVVTFLYRYKH